MRTLVFASIVVGLIAPFASALQSPPATQPKVGEKVEAKPEAKAIALPASEPNATKALTDSPRHGEWVEIPLPADGAAKPADAKAPAAKAPTLKTWVSYPERKDAAPVVIVVHEIFGMTDWVRAVADQLAAEGFIAIAPDLLSGKGPEGGATSSFQGDAVREAIRKLDANEVVARLNAARDYATALPSATKKSACVGFCWGGSTAWTYATKQPGLNAAIVYYGTAPDAKEAIAAITCPVLGCYGGDDARVTSTVEKTKALTTEAGKTFTAAIYDGAGHGFLRQQDGREGKNRAAAEAAWKATIALLRERLEAAPAAK
jgi:carboxymethylenebutenolidase